MMALKFLRKLFLYLFYPPDPILNIQNLPKIIEARENNQNFNIHINQPVNIMPQKRGLPNLGNTCYLNALLQIFSSTPNFHSNGSKIYISLSKIISWIQQRLEFSISNEIKKLQLYLSQEFNMFYEYSENDPKELYVSLIGALPNSSDFTMVLYKEIRCKACKKITNLEESSLFCILKNLSKKEIVEKLKSFWEEKSYNGRNLLYCENCMENREMVMRTYGIDVPRIFVFYIANKSGKRAQGVDNFYYNGVRFELYGVICYYNSGCRHFIAYTLDNSQWIEYNDAHQRRSFPDFEHAYMLFYKKS